MRRSALLSILLLATSLHFFFPRPARPQGETTSAIVGQVTDASDAAIAGALVHHESRERIAAGGELTPRAAIIFRS